MQPSCGSKSSTRNSRAQPSPHFSRQRKSRRIFPASSSTRMSASNKIHFTASEVGPQSFEPGNSLLRLGRGILGHICEQKRRDPLRSLAGGSGTAGALRLCAPAAALARRPRSWAQPLLRRSEVQCGAGEVPSAECQVPGARCQVPSAKRQVRSAKCEVPSAECQVRSAKCEAPSANDHTWHMTHGTWHMTHGT